MQKRYLPVFILTVVLLIASIIGYVLPGQTQTPPVRVLLQSKGGNVVFAHQQHAAMEGIQCADCHHTTGNDPTPPRCTDCHPPKFSDEYLEVHTAMPMSRAQCTSCHHAGSDISHFNHDAHAEEYTGDCTDCHHDTDIEPEPQQCSNCHPSHVAPLPSGTIADSESDTPQLMEAAHSRCRNCHESDFEDGYRNCDYCHARLTTPVEEIEFEPCSDCHEEPVGDSVPPRVAAFHQQCMGCHEKRDAGPYHKDDCYQCHIK